MQGPGAPPGLDTSVLPDSGPAVSRRTRGRGAVFFLPLCPFFHLVLPFSFGPATPLSHALLPSVLSGSQGNLVSNPAFTFFLLAV